MNFGYIGASDKDVIKCYKIDGDDLIVTYIDGSVKKFYATKQAEENIIKKMFLQALERNDSCKLKSRYKSKEIALRNLCLSSCYTLLLVAITSYNYSKYNHPIEHGVFTTLTCLTAGTVIYNAYELYKENKKDEEIKKYRIMLNLVNKYQELKNTPGIKLDNDKILGINTIDNFSLKEVQRIRKDLINKSR